MSKVLVIAVHPDDETLGCGGTLLKHRTNGDDIYWCIVTAISENLGFNPGQIQTREQEIKAIDIQYGFKKVYRLNLPTTVLDQIPAARLVQEFATVITDCRPETIYLPFHADVHSDHRIAFQAAYSCTKSFRYPFIKNIYMMETLSESEFAPALAGTTFLPTTFVDISDFIEKKIKTMQMYSGELSTPPFPRSVENIKAIATLRGGVAGCRYAEGFMLLREIR